MGKEALERPHGCKSCGVALPTGASFCSSCGIKMESAQTHTQPKRSLIPRVEPPAHPAADPLIGATVAERYVIESIIGRGGMGVVYKVEHAKIGKVMALKLLTGALARNQETVRRFKREALMVSKLSHPNTVQVFDYGSAGGLTYLAMEYLSGYDLGELVERQGPQPFPQMAKIVLQACGALQEAHGFGMVHRDIKPENLFITRTPSGDELVKVLDFGLAKLRETPEFGAITTTGHIVGTPYYMSPEQVRGEDVDARSDIYSLCALMYTCMTGTFLFDAPNPLAVLSAQLTQIPELLHERAPTLDIHPNVSAIVMKGLAKQASDRYQTVEEFDRALRTELRSESRASIHLAHSPSFPPPEEAETATRSEVEQYERRLKVREQMGRGVLALLGLSLVAAAVHFYRESSQIPEFDGSEREPNHDVATALSVPFGETVRGRLGKRISDARGDQDNFWVDIPETPGKERTRVHLELSPLPNMGLCLWVFPKGGEQPQHQFCGGEPGRGVDISSLSMRPGEYLFAVKQDLSSYIEGVTPYLHENVSDDYTLLLRRAEAPPDWESEPNEEKENAEWIEWGARDQVRGTLNFVRDLDVVCGRGTGEARFQVYDAEGGKRPSGAALRVTPLGGPDDKIPVRLHGAGRALTWTERDQASPWVSRPTDLTTTPCVVLELVPNPWATPPLPVIAPATDHEWRVKLIPVLDSDSPSESSAPPPAASSVGVQTRPKPVEPSPPPEHLPHADGGNDPAPASEPVPQASPEPAISPDP